MELKIGSGRNCFYQWDTGQILIIEGAESCNEVHFCNGQMETALICRIREEDGQRVADVPNILLQRDMSVTAYLFCYGADGTETRHAKRFDVLPRPKPESYVYTQTEILTYSYLDQRLKDLEGEGLAGAVADYLEKNPVQAGATVEEAAQIARNTENIEQLSADKLDAGKLPQAVNDALAQAKASGDFTGADGKTPVRGTDYWTEADKTEIKAYVDEAILGGAW